MKELCQFPCNSLSGVLMISYFRAPVAEMKNTLKPEVLIEAVRTSAVGLLSCLNEVETGGKVSQQKPK